MNAASSAKRPLSRNSHTMIRRSLSLNSLVRGALMAVGLAFMITQAARAQTQSGMSEAEIDALAARALEAFRVPGLSIGIVKDGEIRHLKGYGRRDVNDGAAVDADTIFKIASNSKAFTAAALAMLVDEGKISWDDRVGEILPDFRLYDPYVSREITIRDLLTHRSGLGLGAGDLMLWPEPNKFSRDDIVRNMRYLKPASSFRSKYAYDNTLYIVAGEVIAKVSGLSYEAFIDQRIMKPLGLDACFAGPISRKAMRNVAKPHGIIDDEIAVIERSVINNEPIASTAAGGLRCSARDMLQWVETQLNNGLSPDGVRLFSAEQSREMWKPHTIINVSESERARDRTNFKAYGLGWRLADVYGYKQVSHTGTLAGMLSYVTLIPELDLGVVVLTNGASYDVRESVMFSLVHSFIDMPQTDWVAHYQSRRQAEEEAPVDPGCETSAPAGTEGVAGLYEDPWFGRVEIADKEGALTFRSEKSPRLAGTVSFCRQPSIYAVRWTDRTLGDGDAYIMVETDFDGKVTGMRMARIDPEADFSFDFQDLDFARVD